MKILFLKEGICPEAAMESSLEVAKGLPGVNDNFDKFVNHITSSVTNKRSRAEILKVAQTWQVSTFRSDRAYGSGQGRGFRGGPRQDHFGRRSNGRGRGTGRKQTTFHMSIETIHQTEVFLKQYLLKVKLYIHDGFIKRMSIIN